MSLADDANLLLIPTGYKAEKLYSIFPTSGVGDFDFARTTSATRVAKNGFITTVGENVPRLNYDILDGEVVGCPHLLLEPSRTNLLQYSEAFDNSYWSKSGSSVTSNSVISPDGSLNASKLVENTSNSDHRILNGSGLSVSGNVSMSVFAKKGGRNFIKLTNNNLVGAFFDLNNGVVLGVSSGVTAKIEDFGNDWYRCSITQTGVANERLIVYLSNDGINTTYQGDGSNGVYIYGAMLEQGSYGTSYIKTTNQTVTRAAETCNNSGNAATFNDSEGVLMAEISALADDAVFKLLSINSGTVENHITVGIANTSNNLYVDSKIGNSVVISNGAISANQQDFNKISIKYKSGSNSIYLNGFKIDFNSNTFTPTGNQLNELEFAYYTNTLNFYGKTKQIQYHSTALSDSDLEKLTSWTSFNEMATAQLYTIQ